MTIDVTGMGALVLLPTYDEADNIVPMLEAIHAELPEAHVLVIDDNSPDGTGRIAENAAVGVGQASVEEIDRVNILQATFLAMARAVADLPASPAVALIDGNAVPPGLGCAGRSVVGGDRKCLSIAAASIVAKVTRDRIMADLAAAHPGYGWERNAGYPTAAHRAAIARLGVTSHHRRSFRLMSKQASITL